MNPLHCPLAAKDFEEIRQYLMSLSLDELISVTEDMFNQLSSSEKITFAINRYCSQYDDFGGRISFFKALLDNGVIAPIHIPFQYQRDARLVDLIRPQKYEYFLPIAHELADEEAALTDDLEETNSDIAVSNPRWIHVDDGKKESSPAVAAVGDTVELLVDVAGYPEGASVTFDIFDASSDPAMRIETERGKNEGGTARIEWVITDVNEVGEVLKLEFEGSARSKSSGKAPIPLSAVYTVELKDEEGEPLEGINVQFDVAGEKTVVPTNDAGIASIPADDPSIEADVTILWNEEETGEDETQPGTTTEDEEDNEVVKGGETAVAGAVEDIPGQYTVCLTDENGEPLEGINVCFTVDGTEYFVITDGNGNAIQPAVGSYTGPACVKVLPDRVIEGEQNSKSSGTETISPPQEAPSSSADEMTEKGFECILTDENGKPRKNVEVIFTIDGNQKCFTSDDNGCISLSPEDCGDAESAEIKINWKT